MGSRVTRGDMIKFLNRDMSLWIWECRDKAYTKKPKTYYNRIAEMGGIEDPGNMGGFFKETSAIGIRRLSKRDNYGIVVPDIPQEGYTVYGRIKQNANDISVPRELKRDALKNTKKIGDWLKTYIADNWVPSEEATKEYIVSDAINYGAYTAGHEVFDANDAELGLSTGTTVFPYDGVPWFTDAAQATPHVGKDGSSYYNMITASGSPVINADLAERMYYMLTSDNAYMENGKPFPNDENIIVLCTRGTVLEWEKALKSVLFPDNGENAKNALLDKVKDIIAYPYFSSAAQTAKAAIMIRESTPGLKFKVDPATIKIWEEESTRDIKANIFQDYAIYGKNFRTGVAFNLPKS